LDLDRHARWVAANRSAKAIPLQALLDSTDPTHQTYGAILAGLYKDAPAGQRLKSLAGASTSPAYLREEAYQGLANLKDGQYIPFFRNARKRDRDCDEVLRDVLRRLKRERVSSRPSDI
jgi:hypothetical protein